jgi:hypothetical protein
MDSLRSHLTALTALVGGAAYAFTGAIRVTHGDPATGTHNTLDDTAEYLVTGALPVALFGTAMAYVLLGRLAGAPRVGVAAVVPQVVLALMCIVSVVNGEDASFFNALAPLSLLTWLIASIVLALRLRRAATVPAPVAIVLPLLLVTTFPLNAVGGALITGAFWMALATHVLREGAPQPAVA